MNDNAMGHPITPIFIVCTCCSRNITADNAIPQGKGRYICGDCDAGVGDGCPRCRRNG